MLPTAATTLSAAQTWFPLQPQHSQLCRHASHCSHSTLSFAEMLPTAATALSALQNCFPLQPQHSQLRSWHTCSRTALIFSSPQCGTRSGLQPQHNNHGRGGWTCFPLQPQRTQRPSWHTCSRTAPIFSWPQLAPPWGAHPTISLRLPLERALTKRTLAWGPDREKHADLSHDINWWILVNFHLLPNAFKLFQTSSGIIVK